GRATRPPSGGAPAVAPAGSSPRGVSPASPSAGQPTMIELPAGEETETEPAVPGVASLLACGAPPDEAAPVDGGVSAPPDVVPPDVELADVPPPAPLPPPVGAVTCADAPALLFAA